QFIQFIGAVLRHKVYFELGVDEGENFKLIEPYVGTAIAVDTEIPECLKGDETWKSYEMTTDEFFDHELPKADLIFIDADHSYESAKKDLINSLRCLNYGGIIIMHDTDPGGEKFERAELCNDVHKIVGDLEEGTLKHEGVDVNILTLPIGLPGLSLITKKNSS
ncbi:MAG TPA: hypothetical protein DCS66_14570, partial [Flavobacteriaceae bacterium]|nr:hypothetical protein [Flavobacteriaceae bacterium]